MDHDAYLERVRSLLPAIRERASACEQQRRLPEETFKDFQEAGLLRAVQPKRYGGYELSPLTFYEGIMEVGTACPSSAWVLGVLGIHNWQLGLFDDQAQKDIWGEDTGVQASSAYAPTGKVERVDGGFKLSGRWPFSSGCDPAQWVILGGIAPGDGPLPDLRSYLVPRSDYEIIDDWHVAGLAGTGSKTILIDEAFVPEHRTHRKLDAFQLANPGQKVNTGPSYRLPFACVFNFAIASPAIGAAQGALDCYLATMREKLGAYDGSKVADDPFAQRRIAHASSEIEAARSAVRSTWETMWGQAEAGEDIPIELRTKARWTAANVVQRSAKAVDVLFEGAGGRSLYLDNPMQRFWRDVHAMRVHAFNNPEKGALLYGFSELHPGQPPAEFML